MSPMNRALEIAATAADEPGALPYAAVVVLDGKIVGEGLNRAMALSDPTSHGEVEAIRDACNRSISGHAETLEADIAAAMAARGIAGDWTAASLALHTQAVLQGAFILAKARGGPAVAAESVDHLRRYIEMLFEPNRDRYAGS